MTETALTDTAATPDKGINIIINSRPRSVDSPDVSFGQLVVLAGYPYPPETPAIYYEITYRNAVAPERDGTLFEGQTLTVHHGTNIHVSRTDRS